MPKRDRKKEAARQARQRKRWEAEGQPSLREGRAAVLHRLLESYAAAVAGKPTGRRKRRKTGGKPEPSL